MTQGNPSMQSLLQRWEPKVEVVATASAVLLLPVIFVEQTSSAPLVLRITALVNWGIWLAFLVDAVVKTGAFGKSWLRTKMAWFEIAIVVLSFPMLGELLSSLRLARLARLGRLTRVVRIARLVFGGARAIHGLKRILSPQAFPFVAAMVLLVVLLGGAVEYFVEFGRDPEMGVGDAIWWAVVTVTTVGYGDIAPASLPGRTIAVVVMFVGIAFTSILTAQIAAYLVRERQENSANDLELLRSQVEAISASISRIEQSIHAQTKPSDEELAS